MPPQPRLVVFARRFETNQIMLHKLLKLSSQLDSSMPEISRNFDPDKAERLCIWKVMMH